MSGDVKTDVKFSVDKLLIAVLLDVDVLSIGVITGLIL